MDKTRQIIAKCLLFIGSLIAAAGCENKAANIYKPHNRETLFWWSQYSDKDRQDSIRWMRDDEFYDLWDSAERYMYLVPGDSSWHKAHEFVIRMDEAYRMLYINDKP